MVIRPCRPDHPNAIPWDAKYKSAAPLCKVFYDSMGWETDYAFRVPCQAMKNPNAAVLGYTVLVFDLDNYVGRAMSKKDEVIIARKEAEANTEEREDAKSYYYPPDEDEPQEIRDMEEKFQQAVEVSKKLFGTPAFQHESGVRGWSAEGCSLRLWMTHRSFHRARKPIRASPSWSSPWARRNEPCRRPETRPRAARYLRT